ncbi:MAG: DNA polymerase III subunit beta [Anaerolineae bacterium]
MKALVSRNELVSLISKIQSIVPSKPAIAILSNILIEAASDQLIISATDLTISMRTFIEAKVLEEGAITLPAKRFFQLIRELPNSQIELHSTTPEVVFINAGTSHFKIQGMHKNEFPSFPDLSEGTSFSLSGASLKEMLSRTVFAAAREDSRQVLNGILLQHTKNQVAFTGTDGKRLAKLQTTVDLSSEQTTSFILPLKAVEEMIKLLDAKESDAKLTLATDMASLEVGSLLLVTKLLIGQYPDVQRVIPQKVSNSIILHREELMTLLRQVSLFTSDASSSVRFAFTTGNLHLSAASGDIGEGKVDMPVNYGGEKLEIAFNPAYFLDILRHSKDETIDFSISDPYNPGLITDSSNALFVLMPMRLE